MTRSPVFSSGSILFLLMITLVLSACGKSAKHQTNAKTLLTLDDIQTYFGVPFKDKFPTRFKHGDQIGPFWFSDAVYVSSVSGAPELSVIFNLRQFSTPKEAKDRMEQERKKHETATQKAENVINLGDGAHFSRNVLYFTQGNISFTIVVTDHKNREDIAKARATAIELAKVVLSRSN